MARLLNMATENGDVPHDMLYSMRAKKARCILKPSPNAEENWLAEVEESMKSTTAVIQKEWARIQEARVQPLDFSQLATL